jgi:integrase/recombinase XerD
MAEPATNIYPIKIKKKRKINTDYFPKVLKELDAINKKKLIKLRVRELDEKIYSLFLHAQYDGRQEQETLNIYIKGKISTQLEDRENLRFAIAIRDEKENKLMQNRHNFRLKNEDQKINFIDYYRNIINEKNDGNHNWISTEKMLIKFIGNKNIQLKHVDRNFCKNFYNFLLNKVNINSAWQYFGRFRSVLKNIYEDGILKENPAKFVTVRKQEIEKMFLLFDEVKLLNDTDCTNVNVKNAFLFSCWSGLRLSDIENLTWKDIQGEITFKCTRNYY